MSIDKSLKLKGKLVRPRNVFTRIERIKILKDEGKWEPTMSVFGIPKVKSVKIKRKGKSEKKVSESGSSSSRSNTSRSSNTSHSACSGKGKDEEIMIAHRMSKLDSSGIRKVFDLAQKCKIR